MKLKISDQFEKRFIFNSLPSCSIINFCYYKSQWWLKCFNQQWGNHRTPCLLFHSSGWDSKQDSDTKSRLLDSPKCSNHCDWGHGLRTDGCALTYRQRHSGTRQGDTECLSWWRGYGEQVKRIGNWLRHTGDTWGRTWGRRRFLMVCR